MYKLYIKEGANKGCYFDLKPPGEKTIVGRHSSCDIKLRDLDASRRHAEILVAPDGSVYIRDLNSKNGTYVNERRVQEAKLRENDTIRLGNTLCVLVKAGKEGKGLEKETQKTPLPFISSTSLGNIATSRHPVTPPPVPSFSKLEGGATIFNLKKETNPLLTLTGIRQSSSQKQEETKDTSTVHSMIDLQASHTIFQRPEIVEDINQLKKAHRYLSILYEVANTVCSNLHLDEVLEEIMRTVFRVLHPDRGFILLYNEETDELEPRVYLTKSGSAPKSELTYSRSIIRKAIEENSAILCSDATSDERFSGMQSIINYNIRSAMCVPLKFREKLLGVLQVDNRLSSGAFKEEDLELLTGICNLAAMAIENAKLFENVQIETERRAYFARYLPPSVVEQALRGEFDTNQAREEVVTILFSDIRSFTTISENMTPSELVAQLNEYFSEMTQCIFDYEGTIDKFIGDAIMSVFGTPRPREDDPIRAVRCAIAMQKRLLALNEKWKQEGRPEFHVGIGINTGQVMVGNIGSERRREFTVIGDHVNIASRLCSEAKAGEILISEYNYPYLKDHFQCEEIGVVQLKGKKKAIQLYRILY